MMCYPSSTEDLGCEVPGLRGRKTRQDDAWEATVFAEVFCQQGTTMAKLRLVDAPNVTRGTLGGRRGASPRKTTVEEHADGRRLFQATTHWSRPQLDLDSVGGN